MPVSRAVIPAAGLGTRFLPASKAVPKILLPVVDRPAIQYVVEEIAGAGITDICIVGSPGGESVVAHFAPAPALEAALEHSGKDDLLKEVWALNDLARITFRVQEEPLGLGHAVSVARDFAAGEPVAVVLPDEIFDPNESFLKKMLATFEEQRKSIIAVFEVGGDEIGLYGAIAPASDAEVIEVESVIEKPEPSAAPSNLAVVGRYVLEPEIFDVLDELEPGALGEIQLTDGLNVLAAKGRILAQRYAGRRWDVGQKHGYLEAVVTLAAEREDLGPAFRAFLSRFSRS